MNSIFLKLVRGVLWKELRTTGVSSDRNRDLFSSCLLRYNVCPTLPDKGGPSQISTTNEIVFDLVKRYLGILHLFEPHYSYIGT